jgi:hypothetical protein
MESGVQPAKTLTAMTTIVAVCFIKPPPIIETVLQRIKPIKVANDQDKSCYEP